MVIWLTCMQFHPFLKIGFCITLCNKCLHSPLYFNLYRVLLFISMKSNMLQFTGKTLLDKAATYIPSLLSLQLKHFIYTPVHWNVSWVRLNSLFMSPAHGMSCSILLPYKHYPLWMPLQTGNMLLFSIILDLGWNVLWISFIWPVCLSSFANFPVLFLCLHLCINMWHFLYENCCCHHQLDSLEEVLYHN